MSFFVTLVFLGGWSGFFNLPYLFFLLKVFIIIYLIIILRAILPRYRYD